MSALRVLVVEPGPDPDGMVALCQHPDRLVRRHARHALDAAAAIVAVAEGCGIDMTATADEAAVDRLLQEAGY